MSDIASAGIAGGIPGYGTTCRKDVLGRVDVPVVPGATGGAYPMPRAEGKLGEQVPACRAGLGRRIPPVNYYQLTAVPVRCPHCHIIARFFVKTAEARRACLPSALRRSR